jgi:hypothetical protein
MPGPVVTGARDPTEVTHGFTLNNQAWAWLILHGYKIIENRPFKLQEGWYAVHVGATAHCSIMEEIPLIKEFGMPLVLGLEKGVVHGLCKIGMSVPFVQCEGNRWACVDYKFCNVITEVIPFTTTVKARGNLGVWPLKEFTEFVRQEANDNLHKKKTTDALCSLGLSDLSDYSESVKRAADDPSDEDKPVTLRQKTSVEPIQSAAVPTKSAAPLVKPAVQSKSDIRSFFLK